MALAPAGQQFAPARALNGKLPADTRDSERDLRRGIFRILGDEGEDSLSGARDTRVQEAASFHYAGYVDRFYGPNQYQLRRAYDE
jgi:hypothetical protein